MEKSNSKLLIIIGVLVVVLLGLGAATAVVVMAHANPNSASTASITPTTVSTSSLGTKPKTRRISGVIQSINGQSIVVMPSTGKSKQPVTIMLTATTKYRTSTGKASLSDLQVGQMVQVGTTADPQTGALDAIRITILSTSATPTATP